MLSCSLWAVRIKGARKLHLTEADEQFGGPLTVTLCGKRYDVGDRASGSTKSTEVNPSMCHACLKQAGYVYQKQERPIDPNQKLYDDISAIALALKSINLSPEDSKVVMNAILQERSKQITLRASSAST